MWPVNRVRRASKCNDDDDAACRARPAVTRTLCAGGPDRIGVARGGGAHAAGGLHAPARPRADRRYQDRAPDSPGRCHRLFLAAPDPHRNVVGLRIAHDLVNGKQGGTIEVTRGTQPAIQRTKSGHLLVVCHARMRTHTARHRLCYNTQRHTPRIIALFTLIR
ncbi:hypothetical protein EVAR_11085_1 [Eumeta japonica]|uniref:Uncharacterized protein n=1 Tax=Eumeta variegata TaxID=151549 RepID=A0A4C1U507_EUMVA|nr:hypothetical protein EVAR_11085_1 [Eumeta japonica]